MKYGTDPIYIFIFTCLTIISGLIYVFTPNPENLVIDISGRAFYVLLSANICQILVTLYFIKDDLKASDEIILWPVDLLSLNPKIINIIKTSQSPTLKIICYGTNKFAGLIGLVLDNFECLKVEVVLCCSSADFVSSYTEDVAALKKTIDELEDKKHSNIVKLHKSKTPPTLRAVAIYDENNKPIFCSIQPYYFSFEESGKKRFFRRFTQSPALLSDESNKVVLQQLIGMFEHEFNRMTENTEPSQSVLSHNETIVDSTSSNNYCEKCNKTDT